ncbi:MAG: glycosyltransferase family 4 protein, partial [Leptospiraceae bacterium]|nr:glycosyltransferase family 4 protein [Leptospiraceae bacterium]
RVISRILKYFPEPDRFHFEVYASRAWHPDFAEILRMPNVQWIQGEGWSARRAGLWFNATLPLNLRRHRYDVFWGSQQVIPPGLNRHVPVVLTYYDLVLYFFPEAMRPLARWQQRAVQAMSVRRADRILSISKQTNDDMIAHFDYPAEQARPALLGYEPGPAFSRSERTGYTKQMQARLGFVPDNNFLLAVSTIEPRKNYGVLIEAYADAWRSRSAEQTTEFPALVIVGRRGWESAEFYEKLERTIQSGVPVHVLDDLDDRQVEFLYDQCGFFCMPSVYEGFGLPLLEALCHGKFALAADIPCFHEIGGQHARYIAPADTVGWSTAILESIQLLNQKKKLVEKFPVQQWTWAHTARIHRDAFLSVLHED